MQKAKSSNNIQEILHFVQDDGMYSGWPSPSCWACEASWCDREILHFVQDDDSFRMTIRSGWCGLRECMSCWAREASWCVFERSFTLFRMTAIERSFTSFRMTVLRSGWRCFVQDDLVRHAEPAKHLAMTEKSFTSFRMTDLVRIDGHAEPAKHLGVTVRSLALFRMTVIGLGQLIYNFMIVTVSPLIYSIQ